MNTIALFVGLILMMSKSMASNSLMEENHTSSASSLNLASANHVTLTEEEIMYKMMSVINHSISVSPERNYSILSRESCEKSILDSKNPREALIKLQVIKNYYGDLDSCAFFKSIALINNFNDAVYIAKELKETFKSLEMSEKAIQKSLTYFSIAPLKMVSPMAQKLNQELGVPYDRVLQVVSKWPVLANEVKALMGQGSEQSLNTPGDMIHSIVSSTASEFYKEALELSQKILKEQSDLGYAVKMFRILYEHIEISRQEIKSDQIFKLMTSDLPKDNYIGNEPLKYLKLYIYYYGKKGEKAEFPLQQRKLVMDFLEKSGEKGKKFAKAYIDMHLLSDSLNIQEELHANQSTNIRKNQDKDGPVSLSENNNEFELPTESLSSLKLIL